MPWKDKDKRNAKCRAYHARHREALLVRSRKYHAENAKSIRQRKFDNYPVEYFRKLARRHGVTVDELLEMRERQNNACALCDRSGAQARLVLDHDHDTGRVRGWLCVACNTGLGRLGDNSAGLMKALLYVSRGHVDHGQQEQATGVLA